MSKKKGKSTREVCYPTLTEAGLVHCPACKRDIEVPRAANPYRGGKVEKMILRGNRWTECPTCKAPQYISLWLAERHNGFWFPDSPAYDPLRN